jgi:transcription-repair coupling factor (superfamily II helicase)
MILKPVTDRFISSGEFRELGEAPAGSSIEGISSSSFSVIIASLFSRNPGQYLVLTDGTQRMQDLFLDLSCLIPEQSLFALPPWETLPYEYVSTPEKTERERITALYHLLGGGPSVIVTTVESLIRKIPRRDFFLKKGLLLEKGEEYPFDDIIETLVMYGYSREARVEAFGQFSVKGGIIDIFLPTHENPVRLDFFDEELESIREFDLNSQISMGALDTVTAYPRRELILFPQERGAFLKKLTEAGSGGQAARDIIEAALTGPGKYQAWRISFP